MANEQEPGLESPMIDPIDIAGGAIATKIAPTVTDAIASGMSHMDYGKASKLAMDEASRLARAKSMGFDTGNTYYHGTGANIDEFKNGPSVNGRALGDGTYLTKNPDTASMYAEATNKGSPNVLPVHVKLNNPFDLGKPVDKNFTDYLVNNKILSNSELSDAKDNFSLYGRLMNKMSPDKFTELLQTAGYDGVNAPHANTTVIFKPNQIRSKFAAFDPEQANSSKLSYAKGGKVR
jgi:hypothetical protein